MEMSRLDMGEEIMEKESEDFQETGEMIYDDFYIESLKEMK
jgi:hypothetical protein